MASRVEKSLRIAAPRDVVWAALADFAAISSWAPNVTHSCLTSTITEGVDMVRRVQVGRLALLESVVVWEPNQTIGYTLAGLPPAAGLVTNTWHLSAAGDSTDTTLTTTIDPLPGPPGQVLSRVLIRALGRADSKMLSGLAAHLDASRSRWQVSS